MTTVLDFAAGFPAATAIKSAGHAGVIAYVAPSRPGSNFGGKPITRKVADEYREYGVEIAAVWQFGKPNGSAPSDWTTGREGGMRMGKMARDIAFAAGMPGFCPIFFAVDEDITLDQWNDTAVEFFRGVNTAIGREWTGIYGSAKVCAWAIEDNVIGGRVGKRWAWQTRSWSNGEREAAAVLFQRVIDTPSAPGPKVGGITVDVNDVLADDWGQWSIDREPKRTQPAPAPAPTPAPAPPKETPVAPDYGTTKVMHGFNARSAGTGNSNGPRARTPYGAVHTQQAKSTAVNLAQYGINSANTSNPVAYNHSIDGRDTVEMVPVIEGPWAAAEANDIAYHLCIAGSFAEWSRGQWLDGIDDSGDGLSEDLAITRAAKAMAAASKQFGFPLEYAGDGGRSGWPIKPSGVVGHMDFGRRGGGHTDPGLGFINGVMDEFLKRAKSFLAPVAVRNLINDAAAASTWVGARVEKDEKPLKAGVFAVYANAHIYYKRGAEAAYPVPHGGLFETWGKDYGYENGRLGYPTRPFEKLDDGAVQAFEGGTLLRKDGQPRGFDVHGRIGDTYRDLGWENSRLGYPTSEEIKIPGTDNIVQHFEHGDLTWSPSGVILTLAKELAR